LPWPLIPLNVACRNYIVNEMTTSSSLQAGLAFPLFRVGCCWYLRAGQARHLVGYATRPVAG
jgi:hypothetical protein